MRSGAPPASPLDDLAALEEPLPAALAVPDSILGLVELFGPDEVGAEPGGDGRPIFRVHVLIPAGGVVVAFTGVEVGPFAPVVVPAGEVGAEVRFPEAEARAPERHLQARILLSPESGRPQCWRSAEGGEAARPSPK